MLVKYAYATSGALCSSSSRHQCCHHRSNFLSNPKASLFRSWVLRSKGTFAISDSSPVSRIVCVRSSVQEDSASSSDP
jgi:hypothetical protein